MNWTAAKIDPSQRCCNRQAPRPRMAAGSGGHGSHRGWRLRSDGESCACGRVGAHSSQWPEAAGRNPAIVTSTPAAAMGGAGSLIAPSFCRPRMP
jgi:hypothetical protein